MQTYQRWHLLHKNISYIIWLYISCTNPNLATFDDAFSTTQATYSKVAGWRQRTQSIWRTKDQGKQQINISQFSTQESILTVMNKWLETRWSFGYSGVWCVTGYCLLTFKETQCLYLQGLRILFFLDLVTLADKGTMFPWNIRKH